MNAQSVTEIDRRIVGANERFGPFASTHEAMGVALEEWDELKDELRANNLVRIRHEAYDLAAALIRLAEQTTGDESFAKRSTK